MFSNLQDKVFSTKRLSTTAGGKRTWADNLTDQPCAFQPVSERTITALGLTTKAFKLYADPDIDILEKDEVVVNGVSYLIHTIKKRDYGNAQHTEVLVIAK